MSNWRWFVLESHSSQFLWRVRAAYFYSPFEISRDGEFLPMRSVGHGVRLFPPFGALGFLVLVGGLSRCPLTMS